MTIGNFWWQLVITFLSAYFFANINYAIIISKILKKKDIRECGSGNPGSTNMLRTFGFGFGVLTFFLDMLKGVVAALMGIIMFKSLSGDVAITTFATYLLGTAAVLGHVFPVFLKFKGGKGVATVIGFFFVSNWMFSAIFFVAAVIILLVTKYMSAASLFLMLAQFIQLTIVFFLSEELARAGLQWYCVMFVAIIAAVIFFAHRMNIVRLFSGTENKMHFKKKNSEPQQI